MAGDSTIGSVQFDANLDTSKLEKGVDTTVNRFNRLDQASEKIAKTNERLQKTYGTLAMYLGGTTAIGAGGVSLFKAYQKYSEAAKLADVRTGSFWKRLSSHPFKTLNDSATSYFTGVKKGVDTTVKSWETLDKGTKNIVRGAKLVKGAWSEMVDPKFVKTIERASTGTLAFNKTIRTASEAMQFGGPIATVFGQAIEAAGGNVGVLSAGLKGLGSAAEGTFSILSMFQAFIFSKMIEAGRMLRASNDESIESFSELQTSVFALSASVKGYYNTLGLSEDAFKRNVAGIGSIVEKNKQLSKQFGFTTEALNEATQLLYSFNDITGLTSQQIESLTGASARYAQVTGQDLTQIIIGIDNYFRGYRRSLQAVGIAVEESDVLHTKFAESLNKNVNLWTQSERAIATADALMSKFNKSMVEGEHVQRTYFQTLQLIDNQYRQIGQAIGEGALQARGFKQEIEAGLIEKFRSVVTDEKLQDFGWLREVTGVVYQVAGSFGAFTNAMIVTIGTIGLLRTAMKGGAGLGLMITGAIQNIPGIGAGASTIGAIAAGTIKGMVGVALISTVVLPLLTVLGATLSTWAADIAKDHLDTKLGRFVDALFPDILARKWNREIEIRASQYTEEEKRIAEKVGETGAPLATRVVPNREGADFSFYNQFGGPISKLEALLSFLSPSGGLGITLDSWKTPRKQIIEATGPLGRQQVQDMMAAPEFREFWLSQQKYSPNLMEESSRMGAFRVPIEDLMRKYGSAEDADAFARGELPVKYVDKFREYMEQNADLYQRDASRQDYTNVTREMSANIQNLEYEAMQLSHSYEEIQRKRYEGLLQSVHLADEEKQKLSDLIALEAQRTQEVRIRNQIIQNAPIDETYVEDIDPLTGLPRNTPGVWDSVAFQRAQEELSRQAERRAAAAQAGVQVRAARGFIKPSDLAGMEAGAAYNAAVEAAKIDRDTQLKPLEEAKEALLAIGENSIGSTERLKSLDAGIQGVNASYTNTVNILNSQYGIQKKIVELQDRQQLLQPLGELNDLLKDIRGFSMIEANNEMERSGMIMEDNIEDATRWLELEQARGNLSDRQAKHYEIEINRQRELYAETSKYALLMKELEVGLRVARDMEGVDPALKEEAIRNAEAKIELEKTRHGIVIGNIEAEADHQKKMFEELKKNAIDVGQLLEDSIAGRTTELLFGDGSDKSVWKSFQQDVENIWKQMFENTLKNKLDFEGKMSKNIFSDKGGLIDIFKRASQGISGLLSGAISTSPVDKLAGQSQSFLQQLIQTLGGPAQLTIMDSPESGRISGSDPREQTLLDKVVGQFLNIGGIKVGGKDQPLPADINSNESLEYLKQIEVNTRKTGTATAGIAQASGVALNLPMQPGVGVSVARQKQAQQVGIFGNSELGKKASQGFAVLGDMLPNFLDSFANSMGSPGAAIGSLLGSDKDALTYLGLSNALVGTGYRTAYSVLGLMGGGGGVGAASGGGGGGFLSNIMGGIKGLFGGGGGQTVGTAKPGVPATTAAGTAVTGSLSDNIVGGISGAISNQAFAMLDQSNMMGSVIGYKMGSSFGQDNQAGKIGAAIGQAIFTAIFPYFAPFASFFGSFFGQVIGSLFGKTEWKELRNELGQSLTKQLVSVARAGFLNIPIFPGGPAARYQGFDKDWTAEMLVAEDGKDWIFPDWNFKDLSKFTPTGYTGTGVGVNPALANTWQDKYGGPGSDINAYVSALGGKYGLYDNEDLGKLPSDLFGGDRGYFMLGQIRAMLLAMDATKEEARRLLVGMTRTMVEDFSGGFEAVNKQFRHFSRNMGNLDELLDRGTDKMGGYAQTVGLLVESFNDLNAAQSGEDIAGQVISQKFEALTTGMFNKEFMPEDQAQADRVQNELIPELVSGLENGSITLEQAYARWMQAIRGLTLSTGAEIVGFDLESFAVSEEEITRYLEMLEKAGEAAQTAFGNLFSMGPTSGNIITTIDNLGKTISKMTVDTVQQLAFEKSPLAVSLDQYTTTMQKELNKRLRDDRVLSGDEIESLVPILQEEATNVANNYVTMLPAIIQMTAAMFKLQQVTSQITGTWPEFMIQLAEQARGFLQTVDNAYARAGELRRDPGQWDRAVNRAQERYTFQQETFNAIPTEAITAADIPRMEELFGSANAWYEAERSRIEGISALKIDAIQREQDAIQKSIRLQERAGELRQRVWERELERIEVWVSTVEKSKDMLTNLRDRFLFAGQTPGQRYTEVLDEFRTTRNRYLNAPDDEWKSYYANQMLDSYQKRLEIMGKYKPVASPEYQELLNEFNTFAKEIEATGYGEEYQFRLQKQIRDDQKKIRDATEEIRDKYIDNSEDIYDIQTDMRDDLDDLGLKFADIFDAIAVDMENSTNSYLKELVDLFGVDGEKNILYTPLTSVNSNLGLVLSALRAMDNYNPDRDENSDVGAESGMGGASGDGSNRSRRRIVNADGSPSGGTGAGGSTTSGSLPTATTTAGITYTSDLTFNTTVDSEETANRLVTKVLDEVEKSVKYGRIGTLIAGRVV